MRSRSLMLTAPRRLEWVEETLPPPGCDEILVKTLAGAISTGTELPQYNGTERAGYRPQYPVMTGYESLGEVAACGSDVRHFMPGARVLSFYGHRTAALIPATKAIAVPDDLANKAALLTILGCDVMKGVRKLEVDVDETVLVTGAGTIGLLTVWTLVMLGVSSIDVIEPDEHRRDLARSFGARCAWPPSENPAINGMYQVGFECSSRDAAFQALQEGMSLNGRICVLADGNVEPLTLSPEFHKHELTVVGSSDGWDYHEHIAWYGSVDHARSQLLTGIFDRSIHDHELPELFRSLADGSCSATKVFVQYTGTLSC